MDQKPFKLQGSPSLSMRMTLMAEVVEVKRVNELPCKRNPRIKDKAMIRARILWPITTVNQCIKRTWARRTPCCSRLTRMRTAVKKILVKQLEDQSQSVLRSRNQYHKNSNKRKLQRKRRSRETLIGRLSLIPMMRMKVMMIRAR